METNEIITLVKARHFTTIGTRQAKRIKDFFPTQEDFNKCSEIALNVIIYITSDIGNFGSPIFSVETTRSQKVMFYRKSNNVLNSISKAHRITNGASTENAAKSLQGLLYVAPVYKIRELMATSILNNSPQQG